MVNVSEALEKLGVEKRIHVELFTSPVTEAAKKPPVPVGEGAFTGLADVTVIIDGRGMPSRCPPKGCRAGRGPGRPVWTCLRLQGAVCCLQGPHRGGPGGDGHELCP